MSEKTFTTEGHQPVLIEDWLPIRELGIESVRESAPIPGQFPKIKTLHVWWARAPLAAANGVVLTSLLPGWEDELLDRIEGLGEAFDRVRAGRPDLRDRGDSLEPAAWYREWVLWMCGVRGDAVAAKRLAQDAKTAGRPLKNNPFTWKPAFKAQPSIADLNVLHRLLIDRWGHLPRLVDPTAGGGSIPYTSLRYGLPTWANDLNPVAVGILDATLRASTVYGEDLVADLEKWGGVLVERLVQRLQPFFPSEGEGRSTNYVLANTVACPRTGGPVPLSPNWWLDKSGEKTAVRLEAIAKADGTPDHLQFHIEHGPDFAFDPDEGTVAQGSATSPWDGLIIDSDYIKKESQEGRSWPTLFAVRVAKPKVKGRGKVRWFRPPSEADMEAIQAASASLSELESSWEAADVLPREDFPPPIPKHDIRPYGFLRWRDFFTDRQLLVHGTFVEEWRQLKHEVLAALGEDRGGEVMTLLGVMQGKALDYNARLTTWEVGKMKVGHVFQRHDFALKWSFAEFEGASELWPWCLDQLLGAYSGIVELLEVHQEDGMYAIEKLAHRVPGSVNLSAGSATSMPHIADGSIECVNIDPPYYDNVQYAELADFFYVWEKRTFGTLHPERFADELTNKDDEAVANVARFLNAGKRKAELATFDYQQKMQAIFAEAHRILVDDGVMVVWFTHKKAEAWDTLAAAMIEAGFAIEASWPVSTQAEVSLHHAKKNSAKSTIMLVCRKRRDDEVGSETFFEDIEAELRQAARDAVAKFEAEVGVGGVDLQLATYGPTLSVLARHWPVLSSEPDESGRSRRLRPEEALSVAREEVARLRMGRLVGREATFDAATDFWLLAWDTFQAREFPYDEARKLALGVGYDIEDAIGEGLVKKKSGNVQLVSPSGRARRLRRKMDDSGQFDLAVDAVQHMLVTYRDDQLAAARTWLSDSGYGDEQRFTDLVQATVNAIPRVQTKKGLSLEEATLLEDAVVGLFGNEITLPESGQEQTTSEQLTLG